jgi:uncharacterized protein
VPASPKRRIRRKVPAPRSPRARSRPEQGRLRVGFATLSLAAVALALASLLAGLLLRGSSPSSEAAGAPVAAPAPEAPAAPTARAPLENATYRAPAASARPPVTRLPAPAARVLVFVIDDAGYSMSQLQAFLDLPFPLTIAVLPGLPNSERAARAVRAAGKELILHQPMQALGGQNPGPGAVLLGMDRAEVERTIDANLATVQGAIGINNHMGSAVSADLGMMEEVAAVAKRRGIYYLDSRTTSDTTVPVAASREGIRYWERDVFLDNTPDRASIQRAVEDGKKRSEKARPAIMIGHVWSSELAQTLTDLYPQLVSEGFSLSTISRFMVQEASEDDASPRD